MRYGHRFVVPCTTEHVTRSNKMTDVSPNDSALFDLLACPQCGGPLRRADHKSAKPLQQESWRCDTCDKSYPVKAGVARFVDAGGGYVDNFGEQWNLFDGIQIDRVAGHTLSETRLLGDTGWPPDSLSGKVILDAGCGAGRFTDVLAKYGAHVIACDLSDAVNACYNTCVASAPTDVRRGEVIVLQADLLNLPLGATCVDAIHCAGVIQHTSDPERVMQTLIKHLKPGGQLFYNFYEVSRVSRFQVFKYLLRRWTPRWPVAKLHAFCKVLTAIFFWPSYIMSRLPIIRALNPYLPICSTHPPGIPLGQQYAMTLLDTIDWYGPVYETRQDHRRVAELLTDCGLSDVRSDPGRAWARKPD